MTEPTGTFRGGGGLELAYRRWAPTGPPRATVVVAHGLGEHSGRYDRVGRSLADAGYDVWALDHRGHGRSQGRRGHVERFTSFVADLETFRLLVAARQAATAGGPPPPQVLLGHSLGGAIAAAHALAHPGAWRALVLSGPAVGITEPPPKAVVVAGQVLSRVLPTARVLALDADGVSRDPSVVAAYKADPLVHHDRYTARLAAEVLGRAASLVEEAPALQVPLLVVHGTDDALVGVEASRAFVAAAGSADKELREYPGLHHEVFNEPEGPQVLADVIAWLDARLPGAS